MTTSNIVKEILADAEKEAKEIALKAEKEEKEIIKQYAEKIKKMENDFLQEKQKKEAVMNNKTKSLAESEKNNAILKKKREILKKAFEKAKEDFSNLSKQEIEKLLTASITNIQEKEGIIYANEDCFSIMEKIIKKEGKNFKMKKNKDFPGGFLFVNDKVEMDFSFDAIIDKKVKLKMELQIASILFD